MFSYFFGDASQTLEESRETDTKKDTEKHSEKDRKTDVEMDAELRLLRAQLSALQEQCGEGGYIAYCGYNPASPAYSAFKTEGAAPCDVWFVDGDLSNVNTGRPVRDPVVLCYKCMEWSCKKCAEKNGWDMRLPQPNHPIYVEACAHCRKNITTTTE